MLPTLTPTSSSPTTNPSFTPTKFPVPSPTFSPTIYTENNDLVILGVGAAMGGGLMLVLGSVIFIKRRSVRRTLEAEKWTDAELRALEEKYQITHDFEELCQVVPHRSRASVAEKAKSFQQKSKSTFQSQFRGSFLPSERFAFVQEISPPLSTLRQVELETGSTNIFPPPGLTSLSLSSSNNPTFDRKTNATEFSY